MTDDAIRALGEQHGWNITAMARAAGRPGSGAFERHARKVKAGTPLRADAPVVVAPPSPDLPTDELVAERKRRFELRRKYEDARTLIPVKLKSSQPIGLLFFGDPHLDDDGTDLGLVEEHARIVRETDGMYAATPGDVTNNWFGRLERLYGQQATTRAEGYRLAEWFFEIVEKWLFVVRGNHDVWSGAGDPLQWILRGAGVFQQEADVRVALRFPGDREVRIHCRHDFPGRSIYNPAHGPLREAIFGSRDHVKIAGHTHESAYSVQRDPDTGIAMHLLRVASYKVFDRYALELSLKNRALGPACCLVIDPRLPPLHPDLIKVAWDPAEGADLLRWARARKVAA